MTTTQNAEGSNRYKDTRAASIASQATFARRRHAKWIAELEAAGIKVEIPDNYTGLPLDER